MHTLIRTLLVAGGIIVPAVSHAQSPEREIPRTSGKVLVLDNERIMEGDIVREGDRYRIRRNAGETWVPVEKVRLVCDSLDEVYHNMRSRANPRDPDELLKLARWCLQHGMREQARKDVQAILALRPQNAEAQRLWKAVQKPAPVAAAIVPAAAQEVEPPLPAVGLSLELQGMFSSKIQMILMNTCANCHAAGHGGTFKLSRVYNDGSTNRRATQQNIAAVVAALNLDDWPSSPLLLKAVSLHGDAAKPPLKSRQAPAYRMLEEWVQQVVADMPRRPSPVAAAPAKTPAEPQTLSERTVFAATALPAPKDVPTSETPASSPPKPAAPPAGKPAQPVEPVDPFDPVPFNQQSNRGSN